MKAIKRIDLSNLSVHKEYIQAHCEYVSDVFCDSIYFFGGSRNCFSWTPEASLKHQDFILATINGACKTDFVFED